MIVDRVAMYECKYEYVNMNAIAMNVGTSTCHLLCMYVLYICMYVRMYICMKTKKIPADQDSLLVYVCM